VGRHNASLKQKQADGNGLKMPTRKQIADSRTSLLKKYSVSKSLFRPSILTPDQDSSSQPMRRKVLPVGPRTLKNFAIFRYLAKRFLENIQYSID